GVKNILAIACGISDGLGFGDNSKAALITRGLKELVGFGVAMGGKKETFFGLSGLGDLVVTATSKYSRNRYLGEEIGKGRKPREVIQSMKMVAEGYYCVKGVYLKARELNLSMPITEEVYKVLYENAPPSKSLYSLMKRELKSEFG
ncbi:MAG: NAD(P)H-dependent glycerol-3-phosphate dehydrogenase, partial [Candidatus Hydrogenedentota bacterium]